MRTTSEYLNLLKQFKLNRAAAYGIKSLGLFGSAARGELHEGSDVDVLYDLHRRQYIPRFNTCFTSRCCNAMFNQFANIVTNNCFII